MGTTPDRSIEIASRHAVYLEGLKTGYANEFAKFLKVMQRDIIDQMRGINDPASMSYQRRNALLRAVNDTIKAGVTNYEKVWLSQVSELGQYAADFEMRALGQVLKHDYVLPSPNQLANAAFSTPLSAKGIYEGQLLKPFFKDIMGKTAQRVQGAIRLASAQGQTTQELVRRIMGTRAAKFKDGLMNLTRRDANALARTSLHHVAQTARESLWEANSDVIEQVEFIAVLDGKTSVLCRALSGERYDVGTGPVPPLHINCRSTRVAVFNDGLDFLDKLGSQFARGPNGVSHVSPDLSYYGWLKTQPAAFQDSVIGPARGALLRNGGLSSERFAQLQLNKNFKPLTLGDMRKLEPLAFSRAFGPVDNIPSFVRAVDVAIYRSLIEKGKASGVEHLSAYNSVTGMTFSSSGSKHFVGISKELERAMLAARSKVVVHHNHPNSRSFSPQDMLMVGRYRGMSELYAHGHDGSSYLTTGLEKFGQLALDKANNAAAAPFLARAAEFHSRADMSELFHHVVTMALKKSNLVAYEFEFSGNMAEVYARNKAVIDSIIEGL